jgi:hypothetical protein
LTSITELLFKEFLVMNDSAFPKPTAVKNTTGSFKAVNSHFGNWDIVVVIVTRLGAERSGFRISVGARAFFFSKHPEGLWAPHSPPIQWVLAFICGAAGV